jgi:hypothetical protein
VPFTGLATVMFAAKTGCDSISPESVARTNRGVRRPAAWPTNKQFLLMNNIILLGDT